MHPPSASDTSVMYRSFNIPTTCVVEGVSALLGQIETEFSLRIWELFTVYEG
jgi:hypothetical protein